MKVFKWSLISLTSIFLIFGFISYMALRLSLPAIDGTISTPDVIAKASLQRDAIGTASINAKTEYDAAFLLGYAHAQDRLFQMDLLRRQSAGELSEIFGERALGIDKKHRFHQFRKRAENIYLTLTDHEKTILKQYTKGVNQAAESPLLKPFEYIVTSSEFAPWRPVDSLLASFSMYIDLQLTQTEIDFSLTALKELYDEDMYAFFTLPSTYQAAIDKSVIPLNKIEIPQLPALTKTSSQTKLTYSYNTVLEQADYGSNNWAVAGELTASASAMLSNDMHLGLRVPAIWYRTQLNYQIDEQKVTITGVSLPGTPAVIVGSNSYIAWGFTNANVDNVDWVKLDTNTPTTSVTENIVTPDKVELYTFEMSEFGPVREFNGQRYALKWVAHQSFAVNMKIADMAKMTTVKEALGLSASVRIPVQNMVLADSQGTVAFQLTGAMSKRIPIARHAISEAQFSQDWEQAQFTPANLVEPESGRVWSANARVIGTDDLEQFGDGGYALGARQQQIVNLLMQQDTFTENDFYDIQLDNQAIFLGPWHDLLIDSLRNNPQKYAKDINILANWAACACPDSIAYTLVRRFRSTVINQLFAPINETFKSYDLSVSYLMRGIEPAVWALLNEQSPSWLPEGNIDYVTFLTSAYDNTKTNLIKTHGAKSDALTELRWGNVNKLAIKHPFSGTFGIFSTLLDMQIVEGFGDSYLPAVQSNSFGASQRLIVRPGNEDMAILTIPGGQSGHFLSAYYRTGFDDYSSHADTPLLPSTPEHTLVFTPGL